MSLVEVAELPDDGQHPLLGVALRLHHHVVLRRAQRVPVVLRIENKKPCRDTVGATSPQSLGLGSRAETLWVPLAPLIKVWRT